MYLFIYAFNAHLIFFSFFHNFSNSFYRLRTIGMSVISFQDPTGAIDASIHRKVLAEGGFGKDISVGSVLILQKVFHCFGQILKFFFHECRLFVDFSVIFFVSTTSFNHNPYGFFVKLDCYVPICIRTLIEALYSCRFQFSHLHALHVI